MTDEDATPFSMPDAPAAGKGIEAPAGSKPGAAAAAGKRPAPGLYVTATPIGNAADITLRAIDLLRAADVIACEDTRVTGKLLARYAIATPMQPYHEHNAAKMRPALLRRLAAGEVVALVSDAGTPLVSDPGFKLVQAAIAAGHGVTALPGASALLAALCLAGLPTDRFYFAGFLPARTAQRRRALHEVKAVPATLVFLESAQRLAGSLADMAAVLGPRPAAVARELTKMFEEVRREDLPVLAAHYASAGPPKGEVVVVVGPPLAAAAEAVDLDAALKPALAGMRLKEAVAAVAAATGLPRKQVYARALALKNLDAS
ncbi:MAG TPA: 16S rRNA (cytidine(1402)-2'-O)-methyltransferase [Candidatus Sulfotelmatobacter sp.]|nr:16S rRNA (cytidine(1402)-2'-O)-methyltransferase [Candidatus Sulfotelmatobacter sp.]